MAKEKEKNKKFQDLLKILSEDFSGKRFNMLRFLLRDFLSISQLSKNTHVMELFNEIHTQGHISYSNVELLSELADVTQTSFAKNHIKQYKKAVKHTVTEGKRLSQYRKTLFAALQELDEDDLKKIIAFYKLGCNEFDNQWDLALYLEKHQHLNNTDEKKRQFADNINPTAREKLGIPSTTLTGAQETNTSQTLVQYTLANPPAKSQPTHVDNKSPVKFSTFPSISQGRPTEIKKKRPSIVHQNKT